ncbi:MAG TPA: hypothetical protein VFF17_08395 [Thermoanaerobaculia bacterium]|nr:hypothetical protein [Thermoanaerobaculia bacterium]
MRHAAAAAIASILSLTAAIAESRPEPPPVYEMKLIFVGEAPVESLFVIGNSGFRTVEALKSFLSRLPAGARLTWNPGCIRFGEEPLLSSEHEMEEFKRFCLEHGIDFVLIPSG